MNHASRALQYPNWGDVSIPPPGVEDAALPARSPALQVNEPWQALRQPQEHGLATAQWQQAGCGN
jgi:hypothetical protein